ncbi:hypothetical protein [Croceibacterium ferulae]|uniref:hypothetical protein n=1 Tax=Croceibacterium ferulae TaxID=1854641 RepID=UPI000EACC15A|nr:hypothetical protein [Croceibacterium ferulae]
MRIPSLLLGASLALLLPGCAARQAVLVTDTRQFVSAGREAGAEAAAFFDEARRRQLEANAILVASEPSCLWGSAIELRTDFTTGDSLCLSDAELAAGAPSTTYSLRPIDPRAAKGAMQLIGAMGAYLGELSQLTPETAPQFTIAVTDAANALDALALLLTPAGGTPPDLVGAAGPVAELVDYFAAIAQARGQGDAVARVVQARSASFDRAMEALAAQMQAWRIGVVGTADQVAANAQLQVANRNLAQVEDFEARRAILLQLIEQGEQQSAAAAAYDEAAALLQDLGAQHAGIVQLAGNQPTTEQQLRIRQESGRQVLGILDRLARIGTSPLPGLLGIGSLAP